MNLIVYVVIASTIKIGSPSIKARITRREEVVSKLTSHGMRLPEVLSKVAQKKQKNVPQYIISGTVHDDTGGVIVAGLYIDVYDAYTGDMYNIVYPDPQGSFADTINEGKYVLVARGDLYPTVYYTAAGGSFSIDSAEVIGVMGNVSNLNFTIPQGAKLTGHFYDAATASAVTSTGGSLVLIDTIAKVFTWKPLLIDTTDGSYEIQGINPGAYKIKEYVSDYQDMFYRNSSDWFGAVLLNIGAHDSIMLDTMYLTHQITSGNGVIKGVLASDVAGDSVKDPYPSFVLMDATTGEWLWGDFNYDTSTAVYTLSSLGTGSYKLYIDPLQFIGEWYNNKPDFASADPIAVTSGDTTSGINFSFARGGAITGVITGTDGWGYNGAYYVDVYDSLGDLAGGITGSSLADGVYATGTDFATGNYKVSMYPTDIGLTLWYKGSFNQDGADYVGVVTGDTTYNIDFDYSGYTGILSGTITDQSSNPANCDVRLYYANTNTEVNNVQTDTAGYFVFHNLPQGSYKIEAHPLSNDSHNFSLDEWYDNAYSWENATPVLIPNIGDSVNVSFQIADGGRISLKIVDASTGLPIGSDRAPFIPILLDSNGKNVDMVDGQNSFGQSIFSPVLPGAYKVLVLPYSYKDRFADITENLNRYQFQFYNNSADFSSANSVNAYVDSIVSLDSIGVSQTALAISGDVYAGTTPLTNTSFTLIAINSEGYPVSAFDMDYDSHYTLTGLRPGNYYVYLATYGLWYPNVFHYTDIDKTPMPFSIPNGAQAVSVTSGETTGIDFDITGVKESDSRDVDGSVFLKSNILNRGELILYAVNVKKFSYKIYNIAGRKVKSRNIKATYRNIIKLENMEPGVYFIKLSYNNTEKTGKFLVLKK